MRQICKDFFTNSDEQAKDGRIFQRKQKKKLQFAGFF